MTTGFYSLIQYCPDLVRLEVVNIGVVLFCPERDFLDLKVSMSGSRVRRAFGSAACDPAEFQAARAAVEGQVRAARKHWNTVTDLAHFAAIQGNAIRLTPPRQRLVRDPATELQSLFERLVGGSKPRKKADVRAVLDREFASPAYETIVKRDIQVVVPAIHRAVTLPYGYRNGRFNLIRPARFKAEGAQDLLETIGGITFAGRELYDHPSEHLGPLQLVVVAQFPRGDEEVGRLVERELRENHVRLYRLEQAPLLFSEIRENARPFDRAPAFPVPHS